jgi:hypothetical protein
VFFEEAHVSAQKVVQHHFLSQVQLLHKGLTALVSAEDKLEES